jgi:hypothetical protein
MPARCLCQIDKHGHEPGFCLNEASELDNLCTDCREAKATEESSRVLPSDSGENPFGSGPFGGGSFGPKPGQ